MSFFNTFLDNLGFGKEEPPADIPKASAQFEEPTPKQDESHACEHYTHLKKHFRDIGRMNAVIEVLGRDFLTAMPEGAYKSRLGQIAFLYRRLHEDLASDEVHKLLEKAQEHEYANSGDWDDWDKANLEQMRELYLMYCHVDPELMERKARLSYEGRRRHRSIMKTGDWDQAQNFLTEQIDLHRRIAEARCKATEDRSLYEMLLQEYIPNAKVFDIELLFDEHTQVLKKLMPEILQKQSADGPPLQFETDAEFDGESQMWLNRSMLEVFGFDFDRGGLYETGHNPVEGGTVDDTRLVIYNVDESNFLDSLKSALHEGGHGLYIQGLPRKTWRYQPVAMDMGAAVHESQALLVEMIIGRMPEFFEFLSPRLEGLFHGLHSPALSPENLFKIKTQVNPSIDRKKADEASYFFHVLLRFRLERDLIDGSLQVKDLPQAWVEGMNHHLGILPNNHLEGCLQDVHWFVGKFGYFPAYAMGHMMAAQIYDAMERELPDLKECIREGEYSEVRKWLTDNIYAKGRTLGVDDLMQQATGRKLRASYLEKHLRSRYL